MDITFESLRYEQGGRTMYNIIGDIPSAATLIRRSDDWNPANPQSNSNRPRDRAHKDGITRYLLAEQEPIIGSITIYVNPNDIRWNPVDPFDNVGYLRLRVGSQVEVNDGQHRLWGGIDALEAVRNAEITGELADRLTGMGLPMIVVPEARPLKKAQDYADLQTNVKPPTGSLAASMNRRIPINAFMLDRVALNPDTVLMTTGAEPGDRVSFLKDQIGKGDPVKWVSFKTLHAMIAVLLVGGKIRSKGVLTKKLNEYITGREDDVADEVRDFLNGLAMANRWLAGAVTDSNPVTMADVYEHTLWRASGALYAVAHAGHRLINEGGGTPLDAGKLIGGEELLRPDADGLFLGNLVSPDTGKMGAGREGWLAGGDAIAAKVTAPRAVKRVRKSA